MSPAQTSTRTPTRRAAGRGRVAVQKCTGPCGRTLPLSSFLPDKNRKSGRRSDCKECYKARRGPRSKEGKEARALEKVLVELQATYTLPSLADVLARTVAEVRQIGATGADYAGQVSAVRRAVEVHGCREVDEIVEETGLSRWAVDRVLRKLVADRVFETRDSFLLDADADEPGRPPVRYHPTNTPRGEDFTHLLRRAVDDDLL